MLLSLGRPGHFRSKEVREDQEEAFVGISGCGGRQTQGKRTEVPKRREFGSPFRA